MSETTPALGEPFKDLSMEFKRDREKKSISVILIATIKAHPM